MSDSFEADFSWEELLAATASLVKESFQSEASSLRYKISTDTRSLKAGDFYLPLTGTSFDGHHFLEQAFEKGAQGAFISEKEWLNAPDWQKLPRLIVVSDTVEAYLAVAQYHRRRMKAKIVALTGSSGKTTTKEMLFSALSPLLPTQCTQKNFNNEIGVSQTLLSIRPETELMIVEMGMRGLGEIALLSRYAEPDIAMIINVGSAHIGRLGSRENIARAKCEIFEGLKPSGIAVLNRDDDLLMETAQTLYPDLIQKQWLYSLNEASIKTADSFDYQGQTIQLSVLGQYMFSNALAVLKVGEALGFTPKEISQGLAQFQVAEGRGLMTQLKGLNQVYVLDDAYNANPESVRASLEAFLSQFFIDADTEGEQKLKRFLILGGMKELDAKSQDAHEALGRWLGEQKGIDVLFLVGEESQWIKGEAEKTASYPIRVLKNNSGDCSAEIAESLLESLESLGFALENCCLYLKGSRAYALEKIPEALLKSEFIKT